MRSTDEIVDTVERALMSPTGALLHVITDPTLRAPLPGGAGRGNERRPTMTHTSQAEAFLADWNVHCTFGAVPGTHGVDRQEATEPDGQQRRWFAELLQRHGMKVVRDEIGNQFGPVEVDLAAYAEIHVEQGQQHGRGRRHALLGAATLIVAARELVDDYEEGVLHSAVGEITVYPNSPVVASEARILLDLRSPSMEVIDSAAAKLRTSIAEVEETVAVEIDIVHEHAWDQNPYQPEGTAFRRQGIRPVPWRGADRGRSRFDEHEGPCADGDAVRAEFRRRLAQPQRVHQGRRPARRSQPPHRGAATDRDRSRGGGRGRERLMLA